MALSPQQAAVMRGHPTSPGVRDYPGVSPLSNTPTPEGNLAAPPVLTDKYTKDGKPGTPRYVYPWPRDMHADTGNVGSSNNGPKQPGIIYKGEIAGPGFEPWNSRNEKLRRQTIAAAQSGSV